MTSISVVVLFNIHHFLAGPASPARHQPVVQEVWSANDILKLDLYDLARLKHVKTDTRKEVLQSPVWCDVQQALQNFEKTQGDQGPSHFCRKPGILGTKARQSINRDESLKVDISWFMSIHKMIQKYHVQVI